MKKIIQFSGGKDSIVCLHMFKEDPDITAIYVNTGAAFPHVVEHIQKTCDAFGVSLITILPEKSVIEWQKENGLPADIIPCDSTLYMQKVSITYHSPLWNWSHEDVFNYIKIYDITILDNYKDPDSDSLDCWNCTAFMGKTGAARVKYVKENLPEHYEELSGNIALVKTTIQNALDYFNEGF